MRWYRSEIWGRIMCLNGKRQPRTEVKHEEMGSVGGGGWYRRWEILKDPWHRGKTWMPTNRLWFLAGVLAQSKHICKTRVLLSFARWHQRSGGSVVLPRAASDKAPHCAMPFVKSFPVSSRKTPTWEYDNMKCHIEGLLWNWAPRALWYSILGICLTLRLG